MDPILRRSSFFYLSTLVIYVGVLGNYLGSDPWPAFEVIPLFMPVYLASAVLSSERGESYGFLRTLPVTDRAVVRRKFGLVLGAATAYWLFMMLVALARWDSGVSGPATLVFVTLVCGYGLVLGACCQIGIWRFGFSATIGVAAAYLGISIVVAIAHTVGLRRSAGWPVLAQLGGVQWLAGAPWLSVAALAGLSVLVFWGLMKLGIRVKASSEACL
jgi:hypothetical protein